MKTYIPPTMFACLVASSLVAQNTPSPVPKPRPPEPPVGVPSPNTESHVETIIRDGTGVVNETLRTTLKAAQVGMAEAGKAGRAMALQFGAGAKSSSRSLAIQTADVDREKVDAIEEDLSVMARILQKAARSLREDDRFNSMGLELDASFFGSASGARNIYIEGHGALFLLKVEYPLVGPQANDEPVGQAAPPNSEWQVAQDEVFGPGRNGDHDVMFTPRRGKPEPYDEAKVDGLKTTLLEALKNATNIRFLAPQEYVTVVVQGGDATATASGNARGRKEKDKDKDKDGRANNDPATTRRPIQKGESVMTIRVTKADIDALAAGKLDAEGFRKKATVQTYLRRGELARSSR